MKLHSISLKNFKSFRDEITIPLGQITYLIGPNGAGKSNVLSGLKTLSAIITRDDYAPESGDYDNKAREMKLAAIVELSDVECHVIAARIKTRSATLSHGGIGNWLFRRLKYEVSFSNPSKFYTISLTLTDADYHTFISVKHDSGYSTTRRRSIEMIDKRKDYLPNLEPCSAFPPATFLEQIDKSLASRPKRFFLAIMSTTTQRSIPHSTPVQESRGIIPDGNNILNELNDLLRKRQLKFDKFLAYITDGSILRVEPRALGSELAHEATEPSLRRKSPHTNLGSGQRQLILLVLQLFTRPGNIFMLTEPELHLHVRAQKRVHAELKNISAEMQIVVETHSPIFLGTEKGESALLITKYEGRSHVTPIAPDSMGVIRSKLGIAHHDALYAENILFVEGHSEHVAFPKILSTLGYKHESKTDIFNLGGAGGTAHLGLLLYYFKADGRKAFVILDRHRIAESIIASLKDRSLLGDDNHFVPPGDFEDAFASAAIVDAVEKMAQSVCFASVLMAGDIDRQREDGKSTADILEKAWRETTSHGFSKVDLTRQLAGLPVNEISLDIKAALKSAMDHFDQGSDASLSVAILQRATSDMIRAACPHWMPEPICAASTQAARQSLGRAGPMTATSRRRTLGKAARRPAAARCLGPPGQARRTPLFKKRPRAAWRSDGIGAGALAGSAGSSPAASSRPAACKADAVQPPYAQRQRKGSNGGATS